MDVATSSKIAWTHEQGHLLHSFIFQLFSYIHLSHSYSKAQIHYALFPSEHFSFGEGKLWKVIIRKLNMELQSESER